MRIRLVGPSPTARGGIAQFNTQLARVLESGSTDARVLAYRRTYPSFSRAGKQRSDPSQRREHVGADATLVPWFPWTWESAARAIKREAVDIVVIQWWHPITALCNWYLARRARKQGACVIFVCHNAVPHEPFPLSRSLTRLSLGQATSLVALSEGTAAELRALVPSNEVKVVPHPPYDVLLPDPTILDERIQLWRERVGGSGSAKIVLFFGNVRAYKGLGDLIEAFPHVVEQQDAKLVVAGTFFEPPEPYRRRITELGLADRVTLFADYVPNEDVAPLFALADLVALPYRSASQSGVIPIAAMLGKPIVATNVGGIPQALKGTGALVPPRDPEALAAAIVRALENPPTAPPFQQDAWARWRDVILEHARTGMIRRPSEKVRGLRPKD